MQLTDYQFVFIPKWSINGFENYYFTTENKLYNSRTNRIIKKQVKGGYTTGFCLNGKFIKLDDLRPLLESVKRQSKNILLNQ